MSKHLAYIILLLGVFFLATRLYHITLLPIFVDESIHIYWAKLIATTNAHWFISLIDGEPPLFIWSIVGFLKLLPSSWYLIAGRLPSVLGGLLTFVATGALAYTITKNKQTALITCIFIILSPFGLFYDRLASYDSLLTGFSVLTILCAVLTATKKKFFYAMLWGVCLGLVCLTKANGSIFFFLSLFAFVLNVQYVTKEWKTYVSLLSIGLVIGLIGNYSLFFSKGYGIYSTSGIERYITLPSLQLFVHNLVHIFQWLIAYNTLPLFCAGVIGFCLLFFTNKKQGYVLVFLWLIPLLFISAFGNGLYPRHILFTNPYFLIAAAYTCSYFVSSLRQFGWILTILIILKLLPFDFAILQNPVYAPLPLIDHQQYIAGHTSGYGLSDAFQFLDKQKKPFTIITLGTVSSYPYAFNLYYWDSQKVIINAVWPVTSITYQTVRSIKGPTFVILKVNNDRMHKNFLKELDLKDVFTAEKPGGKFPIHVAIPK